MRYREAARKPANLGRYEIPRRGGGFTEDGSIRDLKTGTLSPAIRLLDLDWEEFQKAQDREKGSGFSCDSQADALSQQALKAFLQQPLSKCRVALGADLHGRFEAAGERHLSHLPPLATPVRLPERTSAFNLPLPASVCATTEQDDQRVPISAETDSAAWTGVNAAFQPPAASGSQASAAVLAWRPSLIPLPRSLGRARLAAVNGKVFPAPEPREKRLERLLRLLWRGAGAGNAGLAG